MTVEERLIRVETKMESVEKAILDFKLNCKEHLKLTQENKDNRNIQYIELMKAIKENNKSVLTGKDWARIIVACITTSRIIIVAYLAVV